MKELLQLVFAFAKVGIFGFGGGPSMIPLIEREVVDNYRWLSHEEFVDSLAMGMALPGPIATKLSAYTGYRVAGIPGAVAGTLGMVLPSLVMIIVLASILLTYRHSPWVQGMLKAVRPAVVALLALVVYQIFPRSVESWHTGLIAAVTFVSIVFLDYHPALAILGAALLGLLIY